MNEIYRILRYLKMTPGKDIFFTKTTDKGLTIFTYVEIRQGHQWIRDR